MIRYRGFVRLQPDVLSRGPLPNPTRSLILGIPKDGGLGVGCLVTLLDHTEIAAGAQGEAIIEVTDTEVAQHLPNVMQLWYGKVIGDVSRLTRVEPGEGPARSA